MTLDELLTLATKLADAVTEDINAHGGLTSSDTIRAADVLRLEISRFRPLVPGAESYLRNRDEMLPDDNRDNQTIDQWLSELDT